MNKVLVLSLLILGSLNAYAQSGTSEDLESYDISNDKTAISKLNNNPHANAGSQGTQTLAYDVGNTNATVHSGTIMGIIYDDINTNGMQDIGELGISGITITIYNYASNTYQTAVTSSDGSYSFSDVAAGTFFLYETNIPQGSRVTEPIYGYYYQDISANQTLTLNFGNSNAAIRYGIIKGFNYIDQNTNGVRDSGESGISGVSITLYSYATNSYATAVTSSDGSYSFNDVAAGTFYMYETNIPQGSRVTEPIYGYYYQDISANQTLTLNFGNAYILSSVTISAEKFTYKPGESVNIFGFVTDPKAGLKVYVYTLDSSGKKFSETSTGTSDSGEFKTSFQLPKEMSLGKATIVANYGGRGNDVLLGIAIEGGTKESHVNILRGSYYKGNGLTFDPQTINVEAGDKIIWTNRDSTSHTVVSGKSDLSGNVIADGQFDSGTFEPGATFEVILKEGNYKYFCKLHPWLVGQITASPSDKLIQEITPPQEFEHVLLHDAEQSTPWSSVPCEECTSNVAISSDRKEGHSSIQLTVKGNQNADGPKAVFGLHFEPANLTDFDSLILWIKTKGSAQDTSQLVLVDSAGKSRVLHNFNSTIFSTWTRLGLSLSEFVFEDEGFNLGSVTGFLVKSPDGNLMKTRQLEVFIDDIKWAKSVVMSTQPEPIIIRTDKDTYVLSETIFVSGQIKFRESDYPITIQVFNPYKELVTLNQLSPNPDNTFNFTVSAFGSQFDKAGLYRISAQYGVLEYKANAFFTLSMSKPLPTFPVPDDVLLQIWNERADLQSIYPEVALGNLDSIKDWATNTGWNEDARLAVLIPQGQTPAYLLPPPPPPEQPPISPPSIEQPPAPQTISPQTAPKLDYTMAIVGLVVAIAIGFFVVRFVLAGPKKTVFQDETS